MTGPFVLFICGGKWQKPWMNFLQKKGHKIILVDPYIDSPCVSDAEVHIQCDARDTEKIYQSVQDSGFTIEFVTSDQTDVSAPTVAVLSQRLGLRGNCLESVARFSNKYENRKFLKSYCSDHFPDFIGASSAEEVRSFYHAHGQDIIIKPTDAQSSRGIFRITTENASRIDELFMACLAQSHEDFIMAERFIQGHEITVEGICVDGVHYTLATSSKKHFRTGIASSLAYPASVRKELLDDIYGFHNDFVSRTGLSFGITHTEYLVNDKQDDFWMVEAACRGGGTLIPSHIVPWVSGVDVYEVFYCLTTAKPVSIAEPPAHRSAVLQFFEFPGGFVRKIEGLEEVKRMDGVLAAELEFNVGDSIKSATDDRGRQGFAIVLADNSSDLQQRLRRVVKLISVTTDQTQFSANA